MARNRRVPFFNPQYRHVPGTNAADVDSRDHTSEMFFSVNETLAPRLNRKIAIPELWWKQYNTPRSPKVQLKAQYDRIGKPGRPARGSGPAHVVVVQNPAAPIQRTASGFESIDRAVRVGTFQAGMNIASVARRRRGQ
jgi:hypothetical protein